MFFKHLYFENNRFPSEHGNTVIAKLYDWTELQVLVRGQSRKLWEALFFELEQGLWPGFN